MAEDLEQVSLMAAKIAAKAASEVSATTASNQATLLEKIGNLTVSVKELDACFDRFKGGIGQRIQIIEKSIGNPKYSLDVLETKVGTILWVLQAVISPMLGAIGLSLLGFLSWHFMKK
jgi:hypothetical protein